MVTRNKLYIAIVIFFITLFATHALYAEFIPEGFNDLSTEEEGEVKVYYNNRVIGETEAIFDDDFFEFLDKQFLINKLTFTKDSALTANYFMKRLDPHVDSICYEKNIRKCPFLSPKSVAVIFDREEYKVYLYINANLLKPAVAESYRYVKTVAAALGNINRFNIIANATKNERKIFFSNVSAISKNNKSFVLKSQFKTFINSQEKLSSHNQFRIDDMDYELTEKNYMIKSGLIENNSILFIPAFNLLGVSRESKSIYLKNKHTAFGTPIEVNLDTPSLIEVSKGDQLIYSKFKPTGNFFLNTKDFPNGFYNITIKVTSLYGKEKISRQLFIKNDAIPALGHPLWFVSAGAQSVGHASDRDIMPTISKQYIGTTIYKYRLNRKSDVELGALATRSYQLLTAGYGLFGSRYNLSLDTAVDSDCDLGIGGTYSVTFHNIAINAYSRYFIINHQHNTPNVMNSYDNIDLIKQAKAENGLSIGYNLWGGNIDANISTFRKSR